MDKSKISQLRFFFVILVFLQASSLLPSFSISLLEQDTWIGILLSIVITVPMICIYCTIMIKFQNMNFFQVLRLVCGKFFGTVLAVFYIFFVFGVTLRWGIYRYLHNYFNSFNFFINESNRFQ